MKRWGVVGGVAVVCVLVFVASAGAAQRYASPNGTPNLFCSQLMPCDIVTAINGIAGNEANNFDEVIVEPGSYYQPGTTSTPITTELNPAADQLDIHGVVGEPRPQIFSSATPYALTTGAGMISYTLKWLDIDDSAGSALVLFNASTGYQLVVDTTANNSIACVAEQGTLLDSTCQATGTDSAAATSADYYVSCGGAIDYVSTIANSDLYALGAGSVGLSVGSANGCEQTVGLSNSTVRGGAGGFDVQAFKSGSGSATVTATNSDYVTTSASVGATITGPDTTGNIEADPALVNPAGGDFHETAASPTIDAGATSAANGMFDFDGQTRTEGGLTDIGADEYLAAPTVSAGTPSGLADSTATLNSTLNPGHDSTSYAFDYGTTTALGGLTASTMLAPGLAGVPVSASLTGLASGTEYFWKFSASNTVGSAATTVASFETPGPPTLSALTLSSTTFQAAGSGASIAKHKKPKPNPAPVGTLISYSVTEPTTTTFTVTQQQAGVKHGKRCIAPPKHSSGKPVKHCTRTVALGTFTHADGDGTNSFQLTGRVNGHKLKKGTYQLSAVPLSPSNVTGTGQTVPFHIAG